MQVALEPVISDPLVDVGQGNNQRQLSIAVSAIAEPEDRKLPLNLCLILDHSGSMKGTPLNTVKQAAKELIKSLKPDDRLSVVAFDHQAEVIIANQTSYRSDGNFRIKSINSKLLAAHRSMLGSN